MYKIYPTGTTEHLKLPPNVRPEMCPRAKSIDTRLYRGLYTAPLAVSRILTVGDGDLSFSLSIAKYYYDMFGTAKNVLATTHESYDSVCATYQDGKKHIDFLTRFGALVCHEVDATDLNSTLPKTFTDQPLMDKQFHFILWNFPCIRVEKGADGQVSELEQNRILIRRFFANAQAFLVPTVGEVHLAHKTIEPFSWWGITDIAIEERFYCERTIVFDRCNYPGYINRKVLDKKSFPCNDALVRPIVAVNYAPSFSIVCTNCLLCRFMCSGR
jgi:25S rRNA (uracil2634-N3)-methyltransferase